jgi:ABC-type lipoprotein release transport system permease subunit
MTHPLQVIVFVMIVIAAVLGMLAAVYPAWRAGSMEVLEAVSYE